MIYHCTLERPGPSALIDLKGEPDDVLPRLHRLGLSDPPALSVTAVGALHLLRPAPGHWLLRAPPDAEEALLQQLLTPAPPLDTLIVPVSDAYAWFALCGSEARELMAVVCPLDLAPQQFGPEAATFTEVFGLKTLLWRRADGFDLAVERSYAPLVADWFARVQGGARASSRV